MAPPGAGPTRKSHNKSRKGCRTCKKRHIRCDERFPQCKNCTKHNATCDYTESPDSAHDVTRDRIPPNLLSTPRIEQEIDNWRRSGVFPFPEMNLQFTHHFPGMAPIELRLVYQLSSIYRDMRLAEFVGCTFWVQEIPSLLDAAYGYDFVMGSILAFSATHIAWLTQSAETKNLAYYYSGIAIQGLHKAISNFSRENSDAVLASSILLAWQASDWGAWISIKQGISTIINLMAPWTPLSRFSSFLSAHPKYFSPKSAIVPLDDQTLVIAIHALRQLSNRLSSVHPLAQNLQEILKFAEDFQLSNKSMQSEQIFAKLQPLRSWLFWLPVTLVKAYDISSSAMVLLAQLYILALAIDSSLPELRGAALGSLSMQAVEQLGIKFYSNSNVALPREISTPDLSNLMQFPQHTAARSQLEEDLEQEALSTRSERQGSPSGSHRLSVGSQPGTPEYLPSVSPGMLNLWQNPSLEELSIPLSPFLNDGEPVSRRESQVMENYPLPSEHSFDGRSLSAYDFQSDSPAYSPTAYSPGLLPELPDENWNFDINTQDYTGTGGSASQTL